MSKQRKTLFHFLIYNRSSVLSDTFGAKIDVSSFTFQLRYFPVFCRQFSTLLDAGISPLQAVQIIISDAKDPSVQSRLRIFQSALESGKGISSGIQSLLPNSFPMDFSYLNDSAKLPLYLNRLADYFEQKFKDISRLLSQLAYPMVLLVTLTGVLALFFFSILPNMQSFYQSLAISITPSLQLIFYVSSWISTHWGTLMWGGIVGGLLLFPILMQWIIHGLRRLFFPFHLYEILWVIALTLESGIPLKAFLDRLPQMSFGPQQAAMQRFREVLLRSGSFDQAVIQSFNLRPYHASQLAIAAESHQLSATLFRISDTLRQDHHRQVTQRIKWVQPILLVAVSAVIMMMVVLLMFPMLTGMQNLL